MSRLATSLLVLALASPAFAYNVVNTSLTVFCLFSPTCVVTPVENLYAFTLPGASGNAYLHTRVFRGEAGTAAEGKWVYQYRLNLTEVSSPTAVATHLAIYDWAEMQQLDYDFDGLATDEVFVLTSGGLGTKGLDSAFADSWYTYFKFESPVAAGTFSAGESTYFFGLVSNRAPMSRSMWVLADSGWIEVYGYAPAIVW